MDDLKAQLRQLAKISPSKGFIKASKNRLLEQIELTKCETWFQAFLKRVGIVKPRPQFLMQARLRLMERISYLPTPVRIPLFGLARTLNFAKKAVASTLIMLLAVTSTLFIVEGRTLVEASDDSYLEVTQGTASVKHAGMLLWEEVGGQIEIEAGDLIKIKEGSQAVVHFFDDTELRVDQNSLFLINKLAVSPSFGRQGILEVSLHQGSVWAQTLNIDDGYAGFTLSTRNAIISTLNGTFSVQTALEAPTVIQVLNNKVELSTVQVESQQIVDTLKLGAQEKAEIHTKSITAQPVVTVQPLTEQNLATEWVQYNLKQDQQHLTALRERGISRLTQMAGTLPGQMLYPIKQAKERLKLLVLDQDSKLAAEIAIANNRLSEAIVLLENGEIQKGREALMTYQSMARDIALHSVDETVTSQLLLPHQKTLAADLPGDAAIGLVKDTLHQTAEILAENPVEREKVRLTNSVDRLKDTLNLVANADFAAARDRLVSHQLVGNDVLEVLETISDPEEQKEMTRVVLELRQEEAALLEKITQAMEATQTSDTTLLAILESATDESDENIDATLAFALPLIPEVVQEVTAEPSAEELKITALVDKIYLYQSWEGQQNQIERLLKYELENPGSIDYLVSVRNQLNGRAYDYLNIKILQLQKKADFQKHKAMQRKIERAQRLRET